jgi:hypothetical protein
VIGFLKKEKAPAGNGALTFKQRVVDSLDRGDYVTG